MLFVDANLREWVASFHDTRSRGCHCKKVFSFAMIRHAFAGICVDAKHQAPGTS